MPEDHADALKLIASDFDSDRDNRVDAAEDLRFLAGDQWEKTERDARDQEEIPCLTINQLPTIVNNVAGGIRQSDPSLKVYGVDSDADQETADIIAGIVRQIEYRSGAKNVYAHGAQSAIQCGLGHWRVVTKWMDDSTFDQEVLIERVLDPLSIIWDRAAEKTDRSDAKRCWATSMIHKDDFEDLLETDRSGLNVPGVAPNQQSGLHWKRDDFLRVAEYWYLVPTKAQLIMTNGGRTLDITDWHERAKAEIRPMITAERTVDTNKVEVRLMDGIGWMGEPKSWAGRFLPFVPVVGFEISVDEAVIRHGLIRHAKDPQKLYNYVRSAGIELLAAAPKAPYMLTPDQISGYQANWNALNRSNIPYVLYNAKDKAGQRLNEPPPQRSQPPAVPVAMHTEGAIAVDDLQRTTGIFSASQGRKSNETSGVAIERRQRQGDTGSTIYHDNFGDSIQRTAEILVDLIPHVYDGERQMMILGIDGKESFVPINTMAANDGGESILVNDLSHGRYNVRVKLGHASVTARAEAQEMMRALVLSSPELMNVLGDLLFENSDFPGAQKIAERMKRLIRPEILEDQPPQAPDPLEEKIKLLAVLSKQAEVEGQEAKNDKTQAETGKLLAQTEETVQGIAANSIQ